MEKKIFTEKEYEKIREMVWELYDSARDVGEGLCTHPVNFAELNAKASRDARVLLNELLQLVDWSVK